jgi:hypothetical protein
MMRIGHGSTLALALALALTGACEKAGESTAIEGSGELNETERALFAVLPARSNLVFGGNYQKLMKYWETSPLKTLGESFLASAGQTDGMRDYMTCWVEHQNATDLAGSLEVKSGSIGLTMVFRGVNEKILTTCGERGGMKFARDADGKYVELHGLSNGMGGTTSVGYYFVTPDTAYFALDMPLALAPGQPLPTLGRAELEARIATAKAAPAANDPAVRALMAKADRSKPFWFSGSAAGTPLASAVGSGHGWLDADADSLTLAFAAELRDAESATRAVSAFNQAKGQVGQLPPDLKSAAEAFLADARLTSSGKTLNGRFRLSNDVINKAAPALKGLTGRGM